MFVMSGAVVCQAVSVRVVGEDRLKVIFRRSVRQIKNNVSAAEAAGGFPPKRGRGYPCCKGSTVQCIHCCSLKYYDRQRPYLAQQRAATPASEFAAVCVRLLSFHLVNPVMMADTQPLLQPFLPVVGLVFHPLLRLRARHGLSL